MVHMVRPKSGGSNCEQGISEEWQALQELATDVSEVPVASDLAGDLLGTLGDWNDFLEKHAPYFSGVESDVEEPRP